MTPAMVASPGPSSSISSFMLDSRAPPSQAAEEEDRTEEATEKEVQRLMHEARMWRVANSAQWVAWGVVQAKVPGMDEALAQQKMRSPDPDTTPSQSPNRGVNSSLSLGISSDPLSPEMALVAQDARDKRPEGLVAEALAEGNDLPHEEDDEEEFDYLGYAQERAMLFWGDILSLGIVRKEELPVELLQKVKLVNY